tara:strand:- start:6 stop:242 length:237 start_codon:yes stop_codon:yes gene_type:complete
VTNKEKILQTLTSMIEAGMLTANDVKKELITNLKFKKDNVISQLELVSREEFEILKKLVEKQDLEIKKLKKIKKVKKS